MSIVVMLQLTIMVFVILFFINWLVTLSGQTIKGFRWGDFVLIFLLGIVIFSNASKIQGLAAAVPDAVEWLTLQPRRKLQEINRGIEDTRQTVNAVSGYFKGVAQRELEYQMKMELPK